MYAFENFPQKKKKMPKQKYCIQAVTRDKGINYSLKLDYRDVRDEKRGMEVVSEPVEANAVKYIISCFVFCEYTKV